MEPKIISISACKKGITSGQIADRIGGYDSAAFIGNTGIENIYHFTEYGTTVALNIPDNDKIPKFPFKIWGNKKQIGKTKQRLEKIIGGCKLT